MGYYWLNSHIYDPKNLAVGQEWPEGYAVHASNGRINGSAYKSIRIGDMAVVCYKRHLTSLVRLKRKNNGYANYVEKIDDLLWFEVLYNLDSPISLDLLGQKLKDELTLNKGPLYKKPFSELEYYVKQCGSLFAIDESEFKSILELMQKGDPNIPFNV